MSISSILFLFLTHLAIGIAFTLLLVSSEAGVKFFRFNAGLSLILLALGLVFRSPGATVARGVDRVSMMTLVVAAGSLLVYWATVGRGLRALRPVLVWMAVVFGSVALAGQAIAISTGGSTAMQALTIASFLTSAALLGAACTAMILGHWYLILPSMNVRLLKSLVKFHIVFLILRLAIVGFAVWFAIASPAPALGPSFRGYILSSAGIFLWQRALFGLVGPALLSYLTWETAKIHSTQSATGILYVDFFMVIVGEALAKYLLLTTTIPF